MSGDGSAETGGRGGSVEIQIPKGKEEVFAAKMAKVKRVAADLIGDNEGFRKGRISEIHKAEGSTARKHTLLDVRNYETMRQQVAYLTADGKQMEKSVVVYFRKLKDMSVEYAVDENGVQLAFDADLFDAAPESGVYEADEEKYRVRVYPVFGENLAIERTISMFEHNPDYMEAPPSGEVGEAVSSAPVEVETAVVEETKEVEEDLLTRHEKLIRMNPEWVAWFYKTCHVLVDEKDMAKRKQQYDDARGKIAGMPDELLDLITSSSELILVEANLDPAKSQDKAEEIALGAAAMSSALEGAFKDRADFLRLRIMVAESGKEMRTGDVNYLGQLKSELEVLQRQVRLKKEGK